MGFGIAEGAGWRCSFDEVSSSGPGVDFFGGRPSARPQERVDLVRWELSRVLGVHEEAPTHEPATDFEHGPAHEAARPVHAQTADVVALAVTITCLFEHFVEEAAFRFGNLVTNGARVNGIECRIRRGEHGPELQRRCLREGGPIDVIAHDEAPRVQLDPRVDGVTRTVAQSAHVVERPRRPVGTGERCRDRPQQHGRLDCRRRTTRQQRHHRRRVDVPALTMSDEVAGRDHVGAMSVHGAARAIGVVGQAVGEMSGQSVVVEVGQLDSLQLQVPLEHLVPPLLEPGIDLGSPPPLGQRPRPQSDYGGGVRGADG